MLYEIYAINSQQRVREEPDLFSQNRKIEAHKSLNKSLSGNTSVWLTIRF